MRLPRSLFGRTAVTIALTLVASTSISMGAVYYFVVIPMANRSASDFAAEIVSAAHSLQSMPADMQASFRQDLLREHELIVSEHKPQIPEKPFDSPFYVGFRETLTQLAGEDLQVVESETSPLIWVDVPAHGKVYHLAFDRGRLGINPAIVLFLAIGGGALLTLITSLLEVRRVVKPLERLSGAVRALGRGNSTVKLAEDGPEEIAALAQAINKSTSDLQAMSENRTVMIAGISHDLRTPLTRLEIAVEMLDQKSNPKLISGIRRDLAAMYNLIGQFLLFSKGIESVNPVELDLCQVVKSLVSDLERESAVLNLHTRNPSCFYVADPVALERVLQNLLENAAQYGAGAPIDVYLNCDEQSMSIEICDRGPGIPADQVDTVFLPFHRLETGRNDRSGGSGLGLAIARQLASKYRWTIELIPREGGGTVARVSLPVVGKLPDKAAG